MILLTGVLFLGACKPASAPLYPERRTLTEAVYASGTLLPEDEYRVFANTDGILVQALVEEGDTIRKGQAMFRVESNARKVQESLLSDIYDATRERSTPVFAELDLKLTTLSEKLKADSLNFQRLDALIKTEAISRAEWERSKLQYETTRRDRDGLRVQRDNLKYQTQIEAGQAENQYRNLQTQNQEGLVKSLLDGVIFEVYKKPGERVMSNEPLALAGTGTGWIARLTLDECDYSLVKVGQDAVIKLDAYPDETYRARIREILPKLNRSEQSFYVEMEFLQPLPRGLYGLNLEANILIREKENVLTVPRSALTNDSLYIERNGQKQWVRVQMGLSNLDRIEIVSGLEESDLLLPGKN